jgi:hypothetical protein
VPRVEEKLYDVNVWIDTASFPQGVREVRYEFQNHSPTSSNVPEIGFGAYFRESLKCPEKGAAIVTLADGKSKRIDFDLCRIAGLTTK